MTKEKKNSQEYLERKELMDLQRKIDEEKHLGKMKEFEYQRESDNLHHLHELERQRIKSAEIRRSQERLEWKNKQ